MTPKKPNAPLANTPDQPAAGKGMPDKSPKPQRPLVGKQTNATDGSAQDALALPNDRDQARHMTDGKVDPHIRQAARDLERGLQDTSKGIETDKAYKKL